MTRDEYNKMRKERSERNKRMVKKSPFSPFWAQEVTDVPVYTVIKLINPHPCSNDCDHEEVKIRQNSHS